jgi:hypothetical protein
MEWRRFRKQAGWGPGECKEHTPLGIELLDDALRRGAPGAFTLDRSCTSIDQGRISHPISMLLLRLLRSQLKG